MKKLNFRKTLTVFALMLTLLFATVFTSCGKDQSETPTGDNKQTLADAVTEFAGRSAIYTNGTAKIGERHTVTEGSEKGTTSSTSDFAFAGGISYDEATGEFGAFDADIFGMMTSPEENSAPLTSTGAIFVRDGISYSYHGLSDYNGNVNGMKDAVSEKFKAGEKLEPFAGNLKDAILDKIGIGNAPAAQVKEIETAVKSLCSGLFKGISELAVITVNGDDYTLDVTATICDLIDKCAAAAEVALKNPEAMVGEFYATPEVKAILSPILKNVKAQDVVDVLKTAIGNEYFHETAEGKLEVVINGVGSIVIDKPGSASLEDYLVNTVFEAELNTGAAMVKIKNFVIGTIFGFGSASDSGAQSPAMSDEEIAAMVAEIKKSKDELLEALPTAKITFTIKSGKITRIKAEIKIVSGGSISSDGSIGGAGSDGNTTIITAYTDEKTIAVEFDVLDKMPELLDLSNVEKDTQPTA